MEKLIVKNFGPIKEAEIDLTKYVVFIGDTSTGKSVLAKLIAIFRDNDITVSINRLDEFKKLLDHYNIDFNTDKSSFEYYSEIGTKLKFSNNELIYYNEDGTVSDFDFSKGTLRKNFLLELHNEIIEVLETDIDNNPQHFESVKKAQEILDKFISTNKELPFTIPVYIPAERILNSLISSSLSGLWANNVLLPACYKDFAAKYDIARKKINKAKYSTFNIKYLFENNTDFIFVEDSKLLLSQSSSGVQSLLPLLLTLDFEINYTTNKLTKTIVIEEPELNLFPNKQKYLVEHIVKEVSKTDDKLIITTHSPYILSVLDSLILAKNIINEYPNLKDKVSSVISENKWIDYNTIQVYEVKNDGTVQSIKNEEFKSIDTNAIDRVSDIISEEFDKLTELRYAQ